MLEMHIYVHILQIVYGRNGNALIVNSASIAHSVEHQTPYTKTMSMWWSEHCGFDPCSGQAEYFIK